MLDLSFRSVPLWNFISPRSESRKSTFVRGQRAFVVPQWAFVFFRWRRSFSLSLTLGIQRIRNSGHLCPRHQRKLMQHEKTLFVLHELTLMARAKMARIVNALDPDYSGIGNFSAAIFTPRVRKKSHLLLFVTWCDQDGNRTPNLPAPTRTVQHPKIICKQIYARRYAV